MVTSTESSDSSNPDSPLTLLNCREAIDRIDNRIHDLLMERVQWVVKVGELKDRQADASFYRPEREAQIHRRLEERHRGPMPVDALHRIFREIISSSLRLEQQIAVAYLGPEATYTHQAALKQFGSSSQLFPISSIEGVFQEVESRRADFGVVPVENSTEGMVNHTLDRFMESPLKICGEIFFPLSHTLLSKESDMRDIRLLITHPLALSQCRRWVDRNLTGVRVEIVASTAHAAQKACREAKSAAIAGAFASEHFGLNILADRIDDHPDHGNRFLVIGRQIPQRSGKDKTSLMISFPDQPGFLHQVLGVFAKRDINLTSIESRPSRKRAWEYYFFVDIQGHQEDDGVVEALTELKDVVGLSTKILGSYPLTPI
ncbi:MAG: prephenate dehydratase [Magnetococcus sp. DMHC-6]